MGDYPRIIGSLDKNPGSLIHIPLKRINSLQGERIHIKMNYSVRVVAGLGDDGRINRLFYPETGVIH